MSSERIEPRPYLKPLLFTAVPGLISAVITFIFVVLVDTGQQLLWEQAALISRSLSLSLSPRPWAVRWSPP